MPTLRKRYGIALASTLILAAAGAVCGYYLALRITLWAATTQLDSYASQLMANTDYWIAEADTALNAVDASPTSSCNKAEVYYLRALIFQLDFLKDAGRMQDEGQIECSAAMGHVTHALPRTKPDFILQSGSAVYTSLTPYVDHEFLTVTVQRGRSFVAFAPFAHAQADPPPMHSAETLVNRGAHTYAFMGSQPLPAEFPAPPQPGILRVKNNVYFTRCSEHPFICVTAYTSIPEMAAAHRLRLRGCVALCGLLGACLGLVPPLLHWRNKSTAQQLRRAIRKDQIRMVYQPIVELISGRIVGAEALARWTDEEGQAVRPDVFVHMAEQDGFVGEITRLVVRHVLRELGPVLRSLPDFRVSINVASADLADPGFLDFIEGALAEAGVAPQSVIIEITEGSTVDYAMAMQAIHNLRGRGHSVHIDDFGTGYSSLSYLQNLSVDAIKIDRSFTQSIGTGSVTTAILPQILAMADALHLDVIVEGVETKQQAEYFQAPSPPVKAQGWLFGRPVPALEFCRALADRERKPPAAETPGGQEMAHVA
jgi:sensor c-di-GMP phosphodiesterase-like protein